MTEKVAVQYFIFSQSGIIYESEAKAVEHCSSFYITFILDIEYANLTL